MPRSTCQTSPRRATVIQWTRVELDEQLIGGCEEIMTSTLETAIAKLAALPPDEQDRVGRWLLHELWADEHWVRPFETSQDLLRSLAAETRADRTGGRVTDVDPDRL